MERSGQGPPVKRRTRERTGKRSKQATALPKAWLRHQQRPSLKIAGSCPSNFRNPRPFADLPLCIEQRIFANLLDDAADVLRASAVCRHWNAAADDALAAAPSLRFSVGRRSLRSLIASVSKQLSKCERLRDLKVSLKPNLERLDSRDREEIVVLLERFLRQLASMCVVKTRLEDFTLRLNGVIPVPRGLDFLLAAAALKSLTLIEALPFDLRRLNLQRTDRCAASLTSLTLMDTDILEEDLSALVAYLRSLEVLEVDAWCGTCADLHLASESLTVLNLKDVSCGRLLDLKTPKLEELRVEGATSLTLCTGGNSKIRTLSICLQGGYRLRIVGELREVETVALSANCWNWPADLAHALKNSSRLLRLTLDTTQNMPEDYPHVAKMVALVPWIKCDPVDFFSFPGRFPRLVSLSLPVDMTERVLYWGPVPGDQTPRFAALESLKVAIWQPTAKHLRWLEGLVGVAPRLKRVTIAIVAKYDTDLLHVKHGLCSGRCTECLDYTERNLFFHGLSTVQERTAGVYFSWEKVDWRKVDRLNGEFWRKLQ